MKIEKRNNHKKKIVIGGMIVTSALVVGILATSYSKYRVTESIKLGEGIINYSSADFELVGMYLINEDKTETKIDLVPGDGYILNEEKTKCTVNNTEINASIEYKDNKLYFGDITEKGTKCKVYFNKKPNAGDTILAGKKPETIGDNFSAVANEKDSGIFKTTDDWGTSAYYRGILNDSTVNNWVDFAGFKWRIIRINGDGSVRLIYNGTTYEQIGNGTQIGTKAFNTQYNHNAYVGYMYGLAATSGSTYANTHTNINSSTIKTFLDTWYDTNILKKKDANGNSYDTYVSKEAGFCGDRTVQNIDNYTGDGSGTTWTSYAPYARVYDTNWKGTQTATLKCPENDLYTLKTSSKGNHALVYPIGLISLDEVIYAGAMAGSTTTVYWLYTNKDYWTMSPLYYANVFEVYSNGNLGYSNNVGDGAGGVRPVLNIDAKFKFTGNGTTTDPYRIAE